MKKSQFRLGLILHYNLTSTNLSNANWECVQTLS